MEHSRIEVPDTTDYFRFYGLEVKFELDIQKLKELFLEKSKKFHPDYFAGDVREQNIAVSTTAYNNLAYKTLSSDISRANYLLNLKQGSQEIKVQLPQEFLMDMMELNEEIDALNDENRYDLEDKIQALKKESLKLIIENATNENWSELQMGILKWKYLERLENRLNE